MDSHEVYRYFWIKVTDRAARAQSSRAGLELIAALDGGQVPAEAQGPFKHGELLALAREYLGPNPDQKLKITVAKSRVPLEVEVLESQPTTGRVDDVQVSLATMPSGYSRDDAMAWMASPVGAAWAKGAQSCRLCHAVTVRAPTRE